MSTIQREVVITGNASGLTSEIDRSADQIDKSMKRIHDSVSKGLAGLNVDDSITKKLQNISRQASEAYKDLETRATNLNKKSSDRIRFMQEELRMSERLSKEEKQREQIKARHSYGAALDKATDHNGNIDRQAADEAKGLFDVRMSNVNSRYADERLKQEMMRQSFDQYRHDNHDEDKGRKGYRPLQTAGSIVGKTITAALAALGLASLFTIGGAITKAISEGRELDEAAGRFAGMRRGGKELNYGYERLFEGGDVTGLGMKQADFMDYSATVARQRGGFGGAGSVTGGAERSLYNESVAQLSIERGYGLDQGKLSGYSTLLRAQGGGKDSQAGNIQEMLSIFKKSKLFGIDKGDFAQLGEKIDIQNKLNEEQVNQREKIDTTTSTQIMSALGQVGGSAGDFRQASVVSTINNALTNPGNDFKQAFLFNALRKANPGMSVTGLRIKQEEGIFGKGTLKTVMDELVKDFKGDMLTENVASMTGLSLHQAKVFGERYKGSSGVRDSIANIGSRENLGRFIDSEFSDEANLKRGKENTGVVRSALAGVNTAFGKAGADKMNDFKNAATSGDFSGLLASVVKDTGNLIITAIDKGTNVFERSLTKLADGMYGHVGASYGFGGGVGKDVMNFMDPIFKKTEKKYLKNGQTVESDAAFLEFYVQSQIESKMTAAEKTKKLGKHKTIFFDDSMSISGSTPTDKATEILKLIYNELKSNKNETFEQAVNKVYNSYHR